MVQIVKKEVFEAKEAARITGGHSSVKKYSTLKIIRVLGSEWETYRQMLEQVGYLDQFFAANYLSSSDEVFAAFIPTVPAELRERLDKECIWDPE